MKGELLRQEIEGTLGFLPPFFEPALPAPDVLEVLWRQTRSAYFESPIPARLKTRISTRLSRYCTVPYCLVCHSCELHALGVASNEILDLLQAPLETVRPLRILRSQKTPLAEWPDEGSPLYEAIICAAECVYLRCPEAAFFQTEISRLMGKEAHSRWVALLVFVEASHRWMEAHPEIQHEGDMRSKGHFASMLKEEPLLGDFFSFYAKRIEHEQSLRKRAEAAEEVRRVLEGISRPRPSRGLKTMCRQWAKIASLLVVVLGIISFLATYHQWSLLESWIPNAAEIKANIAFALILGGIALWLWTQKPLRKGARVAAKTLGAVVCLIGVASLFQDLSGLNLGIDELLVGHKTELLIAEPSRMSPYAALVLTLIGLSLAFLDQLFYRKIRLSDYFALTGGVLGFITILGYLYGVNTPLGPQRTDQISLPTAVISLLLASGILCARPVGGIISTFISPSAAGALIRRLLLLLGISPVILGWIGIFGQWKGWYSIGFGFALVVASSTLLFVGVALILGRTLIQTEVQRGTAERLLLDAEFDFRATFEQAAVGVAHIGLDGQWIRVNDKLCQIVGYSREELLEGTFRDINVPEEKTPTLAQLFIDGKASQFTLEKRYLRKDGSIIWGNLTAALLRDASGEPKYILAIIEDISERKKVQEEIVRQKAVAEAACKAKDHLFSVVSHELRTPLTPVLAAISSYALTAESGEQHNTLEMMRRNIEHEVCLIDDLLDIARFSNDKLRLNLTPVDFHALLEEVFTGVKPGLDAKNLRTQIHLDAAQHIVDGDPARLRQTLLNLLDNAQKFTPSGGEITITTSTEGEKLIVQIADTGIGISPENLQRIFEAFEQGEQSSHRHYGGLGLGLTIVKGLVEAHGGSLSVESPGLERGSTFTFTLPTTDKPVKKQKPNQEPKASLARILLVEDHTDTRLTLQRLLERQGHKVIAACCMSDAIAKAAEDDFDLLISDIGLPDGSGIDLLRSLAPTTGHALPAIALSGFGTEEDIEQSLKAGFIYHLTKPVNMQILNAAIAKAKPI